MRTGHSPSGWFLLLCLLALGEAKAVQGELFDQALALFRSGQFRAAEVAMETCAERSSGNVLQGQAFSYVVLLALSREAATQHLLTLTMQGAQKVSASFDTRRQLFEQAVARQMKTQRSAAKGLLAIAAKALQRALSDGMELAISPEISTAGNLRQRMLEGYFPSTEEWERIRESEQHRALMALLPLVSRKESIGSGMVLDAAGLLLILAQRLGANTEDRAAAQAVMSSLLVRAKQQAGIDAQKVRQITDLEQALGRDAKAGPAAIWECPKCARRFSPLVSQCPLDGSGPVAGGQ